MSYSIFTKNSRKTFAIVMLIVLLVSVLAGVFVYFYFGRAVDGKDVSADMDDSFTLGESFTLQTLLQYDNYNYQWINGNGVNVDIYVGQDMEQATLTEGVLQYVADTRTFKVVGVASGFIKFSAVLDNTISHTIPFATKFKSQDTADILKDNYPEFATDNVVDATEIATVNTLAVDKDNLDLADLASFGNLSKLQLKNSATDGIFHYSNIRLSDKVKIFVSPNLYGQYVSDNQYGWDKVKDQIFPTVESPDAYSVVLNKNGGNFANDSGLEYEALEVQNGKSIALSKDYQISRVGYKFDGWYVSYDGGATLQQKVDDSYIVTDDVKLYANWIPITYTLQLYVNNGTENFVQQTFTYDKAESISYSPQYGNYVLIGWSFDPQATTTDIVATQLVDNLTNQDGTVIKLYAVWSYREITLRFYTLNENSEYQLFGSNVIYTYGDDLKLTGSIAQKPGDTVGKFRGWSLSQLANKVDYEYGTTINTAEKLWYVHISQQEAVINVYGVYEFNEYTIHYNANIDGDIGNISSVDALRESEVSLHGALDRYGYRFMGWLDDAGCIWTSGILYNDNQSYYDENFGDKTKLLQVNSDGQFIASQGIYTVLSGQVHLVAQWKANTFNVVFEGDPNEASYYQSAVLTFGQSFTFVGKLEKLGHTMTSCLSDVGDISISGATLTVEQVNILYDALRKDTADNQFNQTAVVVIHVTWQANTYRVYFNYNGGNPGQEYKDVVYGTEYGQLPQPTRNNENVSNGYNSFTFNSWQYDGKVITAGTIMNVAGQHKLVAKWNVKFNPCLVYGTEVLMADGGIKEIQDIRIGDVVSAWDFEKGQLTYSPVVFVQSNPQTMVETVQLIFDNGSTVTLSYKHAFFDIDIGRFVDISATNVQEHIGHRFAMVQQCEQSVKMDNVRLISAKVQYQEVRSYTIITAGSINHFANGFLAAAAEVEYLLNSFTVDLDTMSYDSQLMQQDIERYGLYEYEVFAEYATYEQFVAFNGAYLKVAVGKGITTFDKILQDISFYLKQ